MWVKKSDYIEKYYELIRGKYKIIDESINYYIGMMELAINYVKNYNDNFNYVFIQHKIIFEGKFYDKEYIKYDIKERDFAEYLKFLFFYNTKYSTVLAFDFIEKSNGEFNYELVVARLLFPNYYLYYLEKLINEGDDYNLNRIIKCVNDYELYIKRIINKINICFNKKIVSPF